MQLTVLITAAGEQDGFNAERLAQARSFGRETVDISRGDAAEQVCKILGRDAPTIGQPLVDQGAARTYVLDPHGLLGRRTA